MDAVEYVKQCRRMIANDVQIRSVLGGWSAEAVVEQVEQWAKEHPVKTRQSEFLKIFPSAQIEDETVSICPAKLNVAPHATNMGRTCIYVHDCAECRKCKRDFWLTEISEREADKNAPEAITRCREL